MRVFVTGATGFIGRAICLRLRREGHEVLAWVRSPSAARDALGEEVQLVDARTGDAPLEQALAESDAVINLAGEPLMGGRWSTARREVLRTSRVQTTERIARALRRAPPRRRVLVSGSAVGVYGDRGAEPLTEQSLPGSDFLADLCRGWEQAALEARSSSTRVVLLRTGVVLGREGGALAKMLPPFRFGLGGPIGSGRQYLPWIHLQDAVEVILTALTDERYEGAVNLCAPRPATSRELARALGAALRRPAFLPIPAFALRGLYGASSVVLLSSQNATPGALDRLGYRFAYPALPGAPNDLVSSPVQISPIRAPVPDAHYLAHRRPWYVLRSRATIDAPVEQVFAFFSKPKNLGAMTPPWLRFSMVEPPDRFGEGARIRYRIRLGPIPMGWTTRIERFDEARGFVDSQEEGPYGSWWHEHHFRREGERTVMEDQVYYAPPFGWAGRIANALMVAHQLRAIFGYRSAAIRFRFGSR